MLLMLYAVLGTSLNVGPLANIRMFTALLLAYVQESPGVHHSFFAKLPCRVNWYIILSGRHNCNNDY